MIVALLLAAAADAADVAVSVEQAMDLEAEATRAGAGVVLPANPRLLAEARASNGSGGFATSLEAPFEIFGAAGARETEAEGRATAARAELATIKEQEGPAQIRREALTRTVRVEVNLRGRDLVSWVDEARGAVSSKLQLPTGYRVTWGGQFENFERASKRLALVLPLSLAVIFAMLLALFQQPRYALAVFANVPLAITGGAVGLALRSLPFSVPAAVGFIALAGVSVLNGVVVTSDVLRQLAEGASPDEAVAGGSIHNLRAVLTTAAVAAFGFMPMAIATGAGAEVQRPLATVVIAGMVASTALTLLVFPGILRTAMPKVAASDRAPAASDVNEEKPAAA